MNSKSILIILILLALFTSPVYAPRTPTITTVPPITAQSAGVQLQCFPLEAFPGSVTVGGSGFIRVRCPDKNGAVQFGIAGSPSVTLTPTLVLGVGYINASIIVATAPGNPCNYNFRNIMVGNVTVSQGAFLNRGPLTFGNPPSDSSQFLAGTYDYCLQYQNAPSTGLGGFDIVWT